MAIAAATVFQIQSTATAGNVNGGGFNPANASFLTDGAATLATGNSPVFTSASYNFVAGDAGHWIYISSGTNWNPGWYQIASVAANAATLSADIGQVVTVNTSNLYVPNTIAGVATTASPTAATWGIDYSQSNSSRYTATDLTGATTTCTSATNPFTAQMVGNLIQFTAGTGVTQGWYEIVSVAAGTATLDRSAGTTFSVVTYNTGGAISLGSSTTNRTDNNFFGIAQSSITASGHYFIKGGTNITYSMGGAVSTINTGNAKWPILWEGYASIRGDRPTGITKPTLAFGGNGCAAAANTDTYALNFTGTSAALFSQAGSCKAFFCKFLNSSTSISRIGCSMNINSQVIMCESVSYNGFAITGPATAGSINSCYIHDSSIGIRLGASASCWILTNLIIGNTTDGVLFNTAVTSPGLLQGNTIYGAENKLGVGVNYNTGSTNSVVMNNIIYGLTTGITHADTETIDFGDYNDYFNNTTDVSNFPKGPHDLALNPTFTNVIQVTGTTATSSGSVLTVSGGGVGSLVPGQDYLQIKSGTGVTVGMYGITGVTSTTITTDNALGTSVSGNIVWQVTTGRNFGIGTNLQAKGYPGIFPGALTTGYLDIGAAQAQSGGGSSSSSFTFS